MRDYVRTWVNGTPHDMVGPAVFAPVSDLLRRGLGLTGTKVVCAEGDCGSCLVLLGRVGGGAVRYRAVCSCILIGGQLDGCHVITVEGLRRGPGLTPVQRAMVDCQGTQCGYCTPGFVVAITGLLDDGPVTDPQLRRGLTGNLCRCTGYEPILKAGMAVDAGEVTRLNDLYPPSTFERCDRAVRVTDGDRVFSKPVDLTAAIELLADGPTVLAGGTDLGVGWNKGTGVRGSVLSLAGIESLRSIVRHGDRVVVGAGASLGEFESAMAGAIPEFGRYMEGFGSPPIRAAGTVGGNVATGSPIGDTLPPLMVLGATVELAGPGGRRAVPINGFYTGYRSSVMGPGELIAAVSVPVPPASDVVRFFKVSKRRDLDISTASAAFRIAIVEGTIETAAVAMGGVGPTPVRLAATEAALVGRPMTGETFEAAAAVAAGEVRPITDVRGSAAYRARVAGNLVRKFYVERAESPLPLF